VLMATTNQAIKAIAALRSRKAQISRYSGKHHVQHESEEKIPDILHREDDDDDDDDKDDKDDENDKEEEEDDAIAVKSPQLLDRRRSRRSDD